MKYALAFAGLVAGALAGGECYAPPPKSQSSGYYAAAPASSTYTAPQSTSTSAPGTGYFGVIASRSATDIHLQAVQARGGKFYIGAGPPTSFCPVESVGASSCPSGNSTVFAGGDRTLSLGTVVPGGQQVYVAPDGALSYTIAHSAYIPPGSYVDDFSITPAASANTLGTLSFETGFTACPVGAAGAGYQVYGQTQNFEASSDCIGFTAQTIAVDHPGAWQY
ncbi:uncharacterized protein M421DRAFT_418604 [Didymella exigua CBS 183.55]|uniref:IgE-binding protein n=1 Tax=Didymella exigua CBS 183.55 TaxID=1150837 RepID=A0A6A5RRN8_9PLEO|nr:uncharacterized protein M421DRAFT_418604 [Didymella exigua CBS 183.55]KAF1930289.1 hypothetical protein M421DRAFT_418604 [Didymella exigua CBS 183.55]